MCGAPNALTGIGARTFFYRFHTFLDYNTNISRKVRATRFSMHLFEERNSYIAHQAVDQFCSFLKDPLWS